LLEFSGHIGISRAHKLLILSDGNLRETTLTITLQKTVLGQNGSGQNVTDKMVRIES